MPPDARYQKPPTLGSLARQGARLLGVRLKDAFMPAPSTGSWGSWLVGQPRSDYRYHQDLGDGLGVSVIMPVVQWLQRAFCEAPLIVQQQKKDEWETVPGHPLTQLIARPNDYYGATQLWMATLLNWCWFGEAYWRVLRQGSGQPGELWWLPPWSIEPKWPADGSVFISHYTYSPDGRAKIDLTLEEVVHFRHGLDPRNPRHGLPPLRAVLRDAWSDEEASNWVGSLLRNMGVPGLIISPKNNADAFISDVEMERIKAYVQSRFTGDQRGQPMALGAPVDVSKLAFSPNEFDLGIVRDTAEERVCAALGVAAAVVGFGTGLAQSKVGATMHEMVQISWTSGVIPVKRQMGDELFRTLMPAFEQNPDRLRVSWDFGDVQALQEDENQKATRLNIMVGGGWMKVAEARSEMGLESTTDDEIYLRPSSLTPTDPKDQMPEPEPLPLALPLANGNGNGASHGNRPDDQPAIQRRAFKQGTLADLIHTIIERHATTMDQPPRSALRLATRLWRDQATQQVRFERMILDTLRKYGEAAATATREVLKPQKQSVEDILSANVIHERIPFFAIQAELAGIYQEMYEAMMELTIRALADTTEIELTDVSRVRRALTRAAQERVGLLDLATEARASILRSLDEARAQGLTEDQMIDLVRSRVPSGRWSSPAMRAQILVRHESRVGSNLTAAEYAREQGLGKVLVLDARLGPTDQECELRNGWVVSPSEGAMLSGIEHPSGTLTIIPLNQALTLSSGITG